MVVCACRGTSAQDAGYGVRIARLGVAVQGLFGATPPRGSDDQSRQPIEYEPQDVFAASQFQDQHLVEAGDGAAP